MRICEETHMYGVETHMHMSATKKGTHVKAGIWPVSQARWSHNGPWQAALLQQHLSVPLEL